MENLNIVLIGMPGAGKSTIGVLLAKALLMPYIDTDLVIQQKENRYLQDIINNDSLEKFLSLEEEVLLQLDLENHVIATGGSVIYSAASMTHLKQNGMIFYLKLPYSEINKRVDNITSRGIAKSKGQSLLDVYNKRSPLYEKYADIIIQCLDKTMEEIVQEIKDKIIFQK